MGRLPYLGRGRVPILKILERDAFLKDLKGWLQEAGGGQGRLAFLAGEAGIGKTVLVRTFCESVEGLVPVAVGACDPLSTPGPLTPLIDVLPQLAPGIAESIARGAPTAQVFRTVLDDVTRTRRLIVFEDIHWADEATLDLLRFLGRRIEGTRTLLIATYRDDEVGPHHPLTRVLGDLATGGGVRRMILPPLSPAAVSVLARGSGLDAADLHRRTGGNPFYVTEVIASSTPGIPATVRDAVLARTSRLSAAGRTALEAVAVIGARADIGLVNHIQPGGDGLEECLASGMLRADGQTLDFRHELARQAVLDSLPAQRRAALHRSVLSALIAGGQPDAARMADHAEGAGDVPATVEYGTSAARRARTLGAHRESAAQFARVLQSAPHLPTAQRAGLLFEYAEEASVVDDVAGAMRALEETNTLWHADRNTLREGESLIRRSVLLVRAGRNPEGEASLAAGLTLLESLPPSIERARAYRTQAYMRMLNRDNAEAVVCGEKAVELATRLGDTPTIVGAYNAIGSALLLSGRIREGIARLDESLRLAREAGLEYDAALAYVNLGSALGEVYIFPDAGRYLATGIAYCRERDLDQSLLYMTAWQALCHLYQGRWPEAEETARAVLARAGASVISRIMALLALGRLLSRRGEQDARLVLDEVLHLATGTETLQRLAPVRAARAEAAWLRGDLEETAAAAGAAYPLATRHHHPWFIGELAYWLWRAGALATPPDPCAEPFALQIAGKWAEASEAWARLSCPYESARALADANEESPLRKALAIFEQLGARPMAVIVARRLRMMGVRGIPRGPRPATRAHPAGLTAREVEIVGLIAQGLRNPEIAARMYISVKTVDHHVSAVLAKLGLRSRTDVAREAARLGLLKSG